MLVGVHKETGRPTENVENGLVGWSCLVEEVKEALWGKQK